MLDLSGLRTPLIGPVDLAVEAGECIAILGASGSGKTLLLRAIADLDPSEGTVRLGARDRNGMSAPDWRRLVGLVPAESGWWADRVVDHFPPGPDPAPVLEAVGLPDALGWEVSRLSTGERQRLALARALAIGPRALLLDEPTAALDADAAARVERIIAERCAAGLPILLVTHDPAQAGRLAARRFRMERGCLQPMTESGV